MLVFVGLQGPSSYAITPYQLKASQLLLYVLPSQPHTGSTTAGQGIS